jgi:hypothetical protein
MEQVEQVKSESAVVDEGGLAAVYASDVCQFRDAMK